MQAVPQDIPETKGLAGEVHLPASLQVIKVLIFGVQGVYLSVPAFTWKINNKKKNLNDQFYELMK